MKKVLAIAITFVLAVLLAACGADQAENSATDNPLIKAVEADGGLGISETNGEKWSYFQVYRSEFDQLTDAQISEYANTMIKGTGVQYSALFFSDDDNGLQFDGSLQWIKFGPISPDGVVDAPTAIYTPDANGNFNLKQS